ncbi:hypothetical protein BRADI_4g19450v3 [Brachypodium distachyon]|uniref:Uncharacterized protein n=1 Tax=Brachypodium distachyon TaxID=15368 RepID=A0A2K2CNM5_BRADI|nr:hypothetical protein BRADI_4g19450v3 [Brachypodium distachyon]
MAAAQPRIDITTTTTSIADGPDGGALAFSVLHDLVGAACFLASHPLHAAYALFFSRYLLRLASFFCPLLVSTALLLLVLATVAPYAAATPGWAGARSSMGRTWAIAVAALCAELRPDSTGGGAGLLGQLCSFVLGPGDAAAVLRFGEIMEWNNLAAEPPLQSAAAGEKYLLGHEDFDEIKDEIEEKNVVSEDLKKGPGSSSENRCPSDERENNIKEQSFILPDVEGVEEKGLDGDPVVPMEIKKCGLVKSHSSISRRIRQWEAATSGNFRGVLDVTLGNPVKPTLEKGSFKDVKGSTQLETGSCIRKRQEISSVEESVTKQPDQEYIHVKKRDPKTEADTEICSKDVQAEESAFIAEPGLELQEQKHKGSQDGPELQEHEYRHVQPEQEFQEENKNDAQPEQESQETKHKPASIARRVQHSGASSTTEKPVSEEGSPRKEKEWKKTLACKLYEERIQLKLCRGRAAAAGGECGDDMDMLWEAYETAGGGNRQREEIVVEPGDGGESEEEDGPDEGPVRQLCCLQALKFSTRKMNFGGGGKPSLAKISKVLKRMTALSRVGSRRK